MRRARALVAGLAGLALGGVAAAQEPPAAGADRPRTRLVVERGDGAASCPPDPELRQAVAARLGWDPFHPDATDETRLTLWRDGRQLVAQVDRRADDGTPLGSRTLTSLADDCHELADAAAFAIAVAIDPTSFTRSPTPLAPVVPVPAPVAPPREASPPPPPATASGPPWPLAEPPRHPVDDGLRWQPFGGAAVHTAFLAAPSPAPGASIHGGLRLGVGSARIEARLDVPVEGASQGVPGVVESQILAGALVPCGHLDPVALCGVVAVGALRGVGHEVDTPSDDATAIVALGPRLEVEARLSPLVGVFAHVDGLVTLPRTTLQLDGRDALALPLASVVIAVGGRLHPGAPARSAPAVTEVGRSAQER